MEPPQQDGIEAEIREFLAHPWTPMAPKTSDPNLDAVVQAFDLAPFVTAEVAKTLRVSLQERQESRNLEGAYQAAMEHVLESLVDVSPGIKKLLAVAISIKRAVYSLLLSS
jgi:hypothetical protein